MTARDRRRLALTGLTALILAATLVGFRVDGSAAVSETYASPRELVFIDTTSGQTAASPLSAPFGGAVRLR